MTIRLVTDWPTTRARIIDAFDGELPGPPLETAIVDIYEANPTAVLNAIDSIAESLKTGKINSGWAVLRSAAGKKAVQQANPTIGRDKLIRNADQWLRNAGCMYESWTEVEDDLFGERGRLRTIASTKLRDRYHEAWTEVRPTGETIEAEEHGRAEAWKASRAEVEAQSPAVVPVADRKCSKCGYAKGHADDCELVIKFADIARKDAAR